MNFFSCLLDDAIYDTEDGPSYIQMKDSSHVELNR